MNPVNLPSFRTGAHNMAPRRPTDRPSRVNKIERLTVPPKNCAGGKDSALID